MDISTLGGWLGGIIGSVVGIAGCVVGSYFSIKNTEGPRERAFMLRTTMAVWLLVTAFVAGLLLIPGWYRHLLWIPYAVLLVLGIQHSNKTQWRIRSEESTQHE